MYRYVFVDSWYPRIACAVLRMSCRRGHVRDAIIASRLYLRDHGGIAYDTRDAEFSNLVAGDSACAIASVFAQSARLGRLVALTLALPVLALFAVDTLSGECYEARETAFV